MNELSGALTGVLIAAIVVTAVGVFLITVGIVVVGLWPVPVDKASSTAIEDSDRRRSSGFLPKLVFEYDAAPWWARLGLPIFLALTIGCCIGLGNATEKSDEQQAPTPTSTEGQAPA